LSENAVKERDQTNPFIAPKNSSANSFMKQMEARRGGEESFTSHQQQCCSINPKQKLKTAMFESRKVSGNKTKF
jgi:hypothetical protein